MSRMKLFAPLATVTLLLSACGMSGAAIDRAASGCEWTRYITVSQFDYLSEETARQILAHNETRQEICE